MFQRNPLNSQVLKNKFPEIYREFFSKCQLVVSAPHFFTWAGEYVGYFGGMMVLQKIPLRIYVGLEFLSNSSASDQITIDSGSKAYSFKERKFVRDQYEPLAQLRLLEFLEHSFPFSGKTQPFKIHLLSEVAFGGSGSAGALCSALATALALKEKKISPADVLKWAGTSSKELIQGETSDFNLILRLAWKMFAAYRGQETSGGTVFCSLLNSKYPVFYCLKPSADLNLPLNVGSNYALIDKISFWGGRLDELFEVNCNPSWPIDFGLIYIGEPRGTAPYSTSQLQDEMQEAGEFLTKNFKGLDFSSKKNLWGSGLEVMNFLSCQVLIKLGYVLKNGHREDVLRALLRAVDKHQVLFLLLGLLPGAVDSVTSMLHHQARKIDDLGAGLKSVSTTKKDIILFVFPHGRMREVVNKLLSKLEKELTIDLHLGYASWLDGIEEQGVKAEQFLEQGIYSDFVSKDAVLVREFGKNRAGSGLFLTSEELEKKKAGIDILLEQPEGKIYIKGELVNSKELHSRKATSEILTILLDNMGKEVSNRSLPDSSYSIDRYEMQGKIVYPLIKAFEKRTKKKLPLTIKGAVTDFNLKLGFGDYTLWLREKK